MNTRYFIEVDNQSVPVLLYRFVIDNDAKEVETVVFRDGSWQQDFRFMKLWLDGSTDLIEVDTPQAIAAFPKAF
jgi:hypothetical protein